MIMSVDIKGTTLHQDPLGTSAWNTLIKGRKRWALFPAHIPKKIAKGDDGWFRLSDRVSIADIQLSMDSNLRQYF
jgi:hypothetical protein